VSKHFDDDDDDVDDDDDADADADHQWSTATGSSFLSIHIQPSKSNDQSFNDLRVELNLNNQAW